MIHSRDEKSFYEKLHKTAVPVTLSILSAAMAVTAAFSACPAKAYAAVGTDSSGTAESSDMEDTANTAGTGSSASDAADTGTAADSAGSPADSSDTADSAATALLHPTRMIMNGITINGIDVGGMTEEEAAAYRRGLNSHPSHPSRSADIHDYMKATALETLVAWLYLTDQEERMLGLINDGLTKTKLI